MTSRPEKGTKRTCQNEECARPFYDLAREAFDCPHCGTSFDLSAPDPVVASMPSRPPSRSTPREYQIVAPEDNVMPVDPET